MSLRPLNANALPLSQILYGLRKAWAEDKHLP